MTLQSPNLDDRRFDDLVEESRRIISQQCPEWTDLTPGDPGMMMVELFAHLTEVMIYRLNRLPEKAYIEFLRLIGVRLHPPSAASVELEFSLARPRDHQVSVPAGTRVAALRGASEAEPPVFITTQGVSINPGERAIQVHALHCELVEGELAGQGNGLPGFSVQVSRPPLVAPTGCDLDLVVGIEIAEAEVTPDIPAIRFGDKAYRIWRECDNFADALQDRHVYTVDRHSGLIHFAPAVNLWQPGDKTQDNRPEALAEIPSAGCEIRLWYRRGGGSAGNVAAHSLRTLKDSISGVEVTNPDPATGGRDSETLDNALMRGPQELHSLQRAVTARDFELLAVQSSGAVNRARVFTRAAIWAHAQAGTVEVLLVPEVPENARPDGQVKHATLRDHESEIERTNTLERIDERRPLGIHCQVNWVRYKPVNIEAMVTVRREEDPHAVQQRVLKRLYQTVNPLKLPGISPGWPFGKAFKSWDVYKIISAEPGVVAVDDVSLIVDHSPESEVRRVTADQYQPNTWFAVTGEAVYRSMNNGDGWELIAEFPGEIVELIETFPQTESGEGNPGLVAISNRIPATGGSHVHVSRDCGESWLPLRLVNEYHIDDMAWILRDGLPSLMWATDNGLYEHTLARGAVPQKIIVDQQQRDMGFYAVAVSFSALTGTCVAVAARQRGVFISTRGGQADTFKDIGLKGEIVQVLTVQRLGPHRYLWAGLGAPGSDKGKGCCRWLITEDNPEGWIQYSKGWEAGGCRSLAFSDTHVYAASLRLGVLNLDVAAKDPAWTASHVNCGLPVLDVSRLEPVESIASDPVGDWLLAATLKKGIYRSRDTGATYVACSARNFSKEVTVPVNWILCSGQHSIRVMSEDEG